MAPSEGERCRSAIASRLTAVWSTMNLFDLSGEVAAVLGGTGVLGGAMAEALAAAGAPVAVVGRSEERGTDRVQAHRGGRRQGHVRRRPTP